MSFPSITNRGEFFSNHYLDAVISGDLSDLRSRWDESDGKDEPSARARIRSLPKPFFDARAQATDAVGAGRQAAIEHLHDLVLGALGFVPNRHTIELKRNTEQIVEVPVATRVETSTGLHLIALEAGLAATVDEAVDTEADDAISTSGGRLVTPVFRQADKKASFAAAAAASEVFACDEPPRLVLILAGRIVVLAERTKWAEGRFLAADLDAALERNDTKKAGELETIAALFSADALVPGMLLADGTTSEAGQSLLDELTENSQKHAVGVSKELRTGIRESIEILANEVIAQRDHQARERNQKLFTRTDVDARDLTRQCLRYLYRILVLLYAESRPELGIVPADDEAYLDGYSLDRLRELIDVPLHDDRARNGTHLHESLNRLFELVNAGYHADYAEQQLTFATADQSGPNATGASTERYVQFPGLDAQLFDPASTRLIDAVPLRNEAVQAVLARLMLSKGKGKHGTAGYISHAQLGINQLGAVYEGLMAYTGFYATEDLFEVAKPAKGGGGADPSDGTWMLPVADADGPDGDAYPDEVFVTREDPATGERVRVRHAKDSFVFRLSGRDRQRSASYYTPEVLTRCVVKHALAELLGGDDYAPEHGSSGITSAAELLELTICEPALGSGAFANEAINQLAAEYLRRRQAELGEQLDPDRYARELQKTKAHFALHQTYGVDLNATAVELAEVSLWLNAMYPGLKAPWFGLQLRAGNSLIGCRRATWRASQLKAKPWAQTKKPNIAPPVDRMLNVALAQHAPAGGADRGGDAEGDAGSDDASGAELHHFLFPGHGWAAVADRKEAKELRPDEVAELKAWRKKMLAAPKPSDEPRLVALAAGVERCWAEATDRIRLIQRGLRRQIGVYGTDEPESPSLPASRQEAEAALRSPDSPLGRLRTLMDAWVGLWFWPVDAEATPPSWADWLSVAEALIRPDPADAALAAAGEAQLDLFDNLTALLEAEQTDPDQVPVAELRAQHPWLAVALDAAEREGAWHWDLEFAPVFAAGGFDLQVGNPPWVRPRWYDDLVLAEFDPWWGITNKPSAPAQKARRADNLESPQVQNGYLAEVASSEGVVSYLGSPQLRPLLAGVQTNLYMLFMDTTWRHLGSTGTVGLIHPEGHFSDTKAHAFRRATYRHLRRHWQMLNGLKLFEDIGDVRPFGQHVYASEQGPHFVQMANLQAVSTIEGSLTHGGSGMLPSIQLPAGGWDLRPHRSRVLQIDEQVLGDWARLFDEPGTPPAEARLLRPVTTADLEALSVLADQPVRLADHDYHWTRGHEEDRAKTDGTIRWETAIPSSWDEVILQGPHFGVATPFNKQPNENCQNKADYAEWDLENLPERIIPRTNYQRACDRDTYQSRLDHWNGQPATSHWRFAWRRMTQPGMERSLQAALVPPGPAHVHTVHSFAMPATAQTVGLCGLWSALPMDYLVKVSGKADIQDELIRHFPATGLGGAENDPHPLLPALLLRTLRLNCLTADYAPLWEELFDPAWTSDAWTDPGLSERIRLGEVGPSWTMDTPLRRDEERRQALVELDAIAAIMLGLSAEQLCAMFRTQFAVLRKYEYRMVFDSEGRKIAGDHQTAGFRQQQVQQLAKDGELPPEYKSCWKLVEQYEEHTESLRPGDPTPDRNPSSAPTPRSVDGDPDPWQSLPEDLRFHPPFRRVDREIEMTRAFNHLTGRIDGQA